MATSFNAGRGKPTTNQAASSVTGSTSGRYIFDEEGGASPPWSVAEMGKDARDAAEFCANIPVVGGGACFWLRFEPNPSRPNIVAGCSLVVGGEGLSRRGEDKVISCWGRKKGGNVKLKALDQHADTSMFLPRTNRDL